MSTSESFDPRLIVLGLDPRLTKEEAIEELTNRVSKHIKEEFGIELPDDPDYEPSERNGTGADG